MSTETVPPKSLSQAFEDEKAALGKEPVAETPAPDTEAAATDDTGGDAPSTTEQPQVGDQPSETTEESLLTEEEVSALDESGQKQYKRMNQAFTQKTQRIAEERKALEAEREEIKALREWRQALEKDPQGEVRRLAKEVGLQLPDEPAQEQPQRRRPDNLKFLDPVFEPYDAEIASLKETIAELKTQLGPIHQTTVEAQQAAAYSEMDNLHPGWREHEAAMIEQAKDIGELPQGGDPVKYLSKLYKLATYDSAKGDQLRHQVERAERSVGASDTGESGVTGDKVTPTAPKFRSFTDAFEKAADAARRGERWS